MTHSRAGNASRIQLERADDQEDLAWLLTPHSHECEVYYDDTDLTGAVYHANYLRFFGRARMTLLGALAIKELQSRFGWSFIVHKTALEFKHPARFGDRLRIGTQAVIASAYKLDFEQSAATLPDGGRITHAKTRVVCVDASGRPVPLPITELVTIRRALGIAHARTDDSNNQGTANEVLADRS